ncbi:siroheme synthase [Thalassotalea nanhaiensis]|uniref:precorrin-2 dehydrogenase n=1 Tax=Thalassotalea nanhaiensis TaxID=3065648 RepID=A0ABY9THP3_9GAMM|nr:siroheme synthase [Colwelliaceae bacterium SQ345]
MDYFPVFLDAKKLNTVVIGGGNVAARKIELLLKTPASITIVSPIIKAPVAKLIQQHDIKYIAETYNERHLSNKQLVIAATNLRDINKQIAKHATAKGMLLNVVDDPELCNYITPAIIDRSPMIVALSSSGSAPILLQMLKRKIETNLPANYGKLAEFCGKYRLLVQQKIQSFAERKKFWQQTLEGEIAQLIINNEDEKAEQLFQTSFTQEQPSQASKLSIIVIHDQNPDNLTLRAYQRLQSADTVMLAEDIASTFFDFGRRDADKQQGYDANLIKDQLAQNKNIALVVNIEMAEIQQQWPNSSLIVCGK